MDNILISIIVPAYNIEQFIGRCLDSICVQSYKALEIIVVDDGSTDHTGEIIEMYAAADQRIISIHKKNGGVSKARLTGIERATGEYIGFVDGDDYIEPEMYKTLLNNALKYKAQISHCGNKMIFPNGEEEIHYGTGSVFVQNGDDAVKDLLCGKYIEPGLGNKLFHTSIINAGIESAIWDSSIKINEDLLMNYIFFKLADRVIYEDKAFYHYILRKGSAMTSKRQRHHVTDPLKVIQLIKNDISNKEDAYSIIYERYLRTLINISIQEEMKNEAISAKAILKSEISKGELWKYCNSKKLKLMVVGIVQFEPMYKLIRKLYDMVTGISKKYDMN